MFIGRSEPEEINVLLVVVVFIIVVGSEQAQRHNSWHIFKCVSSYNACEHLRRLQHQGGVLKSTCEAGIDGLRHILDGTRASSSAILAPWPQDQHFRAQAPRAVRLAGYP